MRCLVQFVGQAVGLLLLHRRWKADRWPFRMWLYPLPVVVAIAGWIGIFLSTGRVPHATFPRWLPWSRNPGIFGAGASAAAVADGGECMNKRGLALVFAVVTAAAAIGFGVKGALGQSGPGVPPLAGNRRSRCANRVWPRASSTPRRIRTMKTRACSPISRMALAQSRTSHRHRGQGGQNAVGPDAGWSVGRYSCHGSFSLPLAAMASANFLHQRAVDTG